MKLHAFNTANLFEAATDLFQQLGIQLNSNITQSFPIKEIPLYSWNYKYNDTFRAVSEAYFIGVIEDLIFKASDLLKVRYTYEAEQKLAEIQVKLDRLVEEMYEELWGMNSDLGSGLSSGHTLPQTLPRITRGRIPALFAYSKSFRYDYELARV